MSKQTEMVSDSMGKAIEEQNMTLLKHRLKKKWDYVLETIDSFIELDLDEEMGSYVIEEITKHLKIDLEKIKTKIFTENLWNTLV